VLREWNVERKSLNLPCIQVGIGIHTGSACVGNMGAQNRLNYTVIGSSVNMASRLCSKAGPEEILISKDTYLQEGIQGKVQVEDKGLMTIKGFDEKIQVFKVIGI
jgi:class 3 adenylate cyclase